MIAVIARREENPIVEEFFELFKTPWEYFVPNKRYDVVLTTGDMPVESDAKLVLIYCSQPIPWDAKGGVVPDRWLRNSMIQIGEETMPIYGHLTTFQSVHRCVANLAGHIESIGVEVKLGGTKHIRMGYDLFAEVAFLLSQGQPAENALFPTLDLHIAGLRRMVTEAGVSLVEIPCSP